jgi:heterotetrameric sarcosine oxidase delta subunit
MGRSAVTLKVPCAHCGPRPSVEFSFGGEVRAIDAPDLETDFARVFLPENLAGPQEERWYHALGCRTWTTLFRDTRTNEFG